MVADASGYLYPVESVPVYGVNGPPNIEGPINRDGQILTAADVAALVQKEVG